MANVVAAWAHPSSQGTTQYETTLLANGTLSCSCPGWIYAKKGVRGCKHTRMHEADLAAWLNDPAGLKSAVATAVSNAILPAAYEKPTAKAREPVTKNALTDALKQTRSRFANLDLDKSA